LAAYVIGIIQIQNPEEYKEYTRLVPASLEPYGGHFIARGGKYEFLEGNLPANRVVIIEFESYQKAQDWYNSENYQVAKFIRQAASTGNLILVEGV
jgi:uncharacterized protein (DUF1330 family)